MPMNQNTTFVGMDAHKKTINVAVILPGSQKPNYEWQLDNEARALKRLVKKVAALAPGEFSACYEAGPCGYALKRELDRLGMPCMIIAPSLIPVKPGERVKTDRKDARKLATLFKAGLLTEVHPPSNEEEAVRELTRARDAARQDRMRARHRLLKLLSRNGFVYRDGNHWTCKHRAWVSRIRFELPNVQFAFDQYRLAIQQTEERLKMLDRQIEEVAQSEVYAERVGWLRCLRGIDTLTAMTLLAELHGFRRFGNPSQLMAYLGLTPSEYSSSNRARRGGITKAGNSRVRRALVEAAQSYRHRPAVRGKLKKRRQGQPAAVIAIADRAQVRLHGRYFKMKEGLKKPHNVVVIAIARELVGFVWAVLQHENLASI